MIIDGSIYLDLEIVGKKTIKNFLTVNDLVDFQIIETAGTSLPIIYMSFVTSDSEISNHFVRNNEVTIKVGESEESADSFTVSIYSHNPPNNDTQGGRKFVEFGGFIRSQNYMVNLENNVYWGNSLLVSQKALLEKLGLKPGNGFKTTITRTNENQVRWMQMNQTLCQFLANTLIHMDIMPNFPLFTFDKYGTFHLNDFYTVSKGSPVLNFVTKKPQKAGEVQYFNNFSVEDYSETYNLYSGYNKITEIWGAKEGMVQYAKSYNEPILASTQETELVNGSSRISTNTVQSSNVHNTYVESFVYNSNKLIALSSMQGVLELVGGYYKQLKPTDLVTVSTGGDDTTLDGYYLIDTIRFQIDMKRQGKIHTYVYVTRDNKNNIENYVANPRKGLKIKKQWLTDLMNAISQLRVAYAVGQTIVDGRFMKRILAFGIETKRNLLRSFNIAGVPIDFNSSSLLIQSLINSGNSLMNTLTSMIFPEQIAGILRDYIIRKPSLQALVGKYIAMYVPYEFRSVVTAIADSLFKTTDSLNSIARDNGIKVAAEEILGPPTKVDTVSTTDTDERDDMSTNIVKNIITDFENNTSGLNIPFPIIELNESQMLMPESELRNYIANETIANLTNLGYMTGVNPDEFKDILLGVTPINFNMIDKINKNAGNSYNYRFWGTFGQEVSNDTVLYAWTANNKTIYTNVVNIDEFTVLYNFDGSLYTGNSFSIVRKDGELIIQYSYDGVEEETVRDALKDQKNNSLSDLTSFYIKKSYKDKYRTIPCTKIINASRNAKVYFACPTNEDDLRFYVNSKRLELVEDLDKKEEYAGKPAIGYFPIDLGYTDIYGNPILYNVYYTNTGYNSTGVLFEVKQGGMV